MYIGYILFILLVSFVLAKLEIQIEGKDGWAANLPTWRIKNKWTQLIWSDLPLTGYHLWLILTLLWFLHSPYLANWAFTWSHEFLLLSLFFFIWMWEDFLWFVLNPYYGLKKFNKQSISWHAHWFGNIPVSYIKFSAAGFLCLFLSIYL